MSKEQWEYFLDNPPLLKPDDAAGVAWAKGRIEELEGRLATLRRHAERDDGGLYIPLDEDEPCIALYGEVL